MLEFRRAKLNIFHGHSGLFTTSWELPSNSARTSLSSSSETDLDLAALCFLIFYLICPPIYASSYDLLSDHSTFGLTYLASSTMLTSTANVGYIPSSINTILLSLWLNIFNRVINLHDLTLRRLSKLFRLFLHNRFISIEHTLKQINSLHERW